MAQLLLALSPQIRGRTHRFFLENGLWYNQVHDRHDSGVVVPDNKGMKNK
ncbi:uncharacterized protein PHALS_00344 [Plasmopara halstedii]|uniref:Uncharacterized protein n=1 Tax=Plasmopara halstedii TaxID=4781 RepID=A0A0P1A611_PLAHL|nr:uncharacterized protein PHALS_00344 [Plasmopara halstedii]CEG36022.1 hypothetical protein PHALS_00344 [Plasmopara halstedii]|eukprot:XP_024572391.1 hypothetical protein PHALS_00344 [Plasmopara halstedii]